MDEKELVRKIKNSFKAKKSRAQVTKNLQKKGYKLAYIDTMIDRAKRPQKALTIGLVSFLFLIILSFSFTVYASRDYSHYENPLKNYKPFATGDVVQETTEDSETNEEDSSNEIIIDESFVNFVLSSVGVDNLHRNPLNFEPPIVNIIVVSKEFYSVIGDDISTSEGLRTDADIEITTNDEMIVEALTNDETEDIIIDSFMDGTSSVKLIAGEAELFAKGYLALYQRISS